MPFAAPVSAMYIFLKSGEKTSPFGWATLSAMALMRPVSGLKAQTDSGIYGVQDMSKSGGE